ncbi:MAG: hypothetical protein IJ222_07835 [Bacteroidales bacterium]|nr:hypothetical protein [Bacteroidales bacterium]
MAASTSVRLNPFKGCDGPEGVAVPWNRHGRILEERPNFTLDPRFHAGCYYVQDSSAMYVGHVFRKLALGNAWDLPTPPKRVLDLCAAPGGKTTDLACSLREAVGDAFELTANEVMKARASVLADNVAVWGDSNVAVTSVDPAIIGQRMKGYYDVVVADVPCSGEGMFRKDPRAVAEWSPELVNLCAARQKRILADVWPALRRGGLLIYSTCTYEDAENDANLEWAARELGGEIIAPENEFESFGVQLTRHGNLLKAGMVPGEGQWVGALRKTATVEVNPGARLADLHPFESRMQIFDPETPRVELDLQDALRYLHRDVLRLPDAPLGMLVVCYRSHPLGFVKNIGSRCNNLYPKSRRILMDI